MSNYFKTYKVFEECGLKTSNTMKEACESIVAWINDKFSDILTAEIKTLNESNGYYRALVRGKGDNSLGFWFGSAGTASGDACIGTTVSNGSEIYSSSNTANCLGFGTMTSAKDFSGKAAKATLMKLAVIRGKYGFAADFIAPSVSINKKIMYAKCEDGFSVAVYSDKIYVEKDGICYETEATLPPQSNFDEKVLSRFALPKTSILPEHLYLSDHFVGSNNPYTLNGKDYVDVLFGVNNYMGFALELA